jgi:hypothetical protein
MPRIVNDALISAGALAILLFVLISVDARVREHAVRIVNGAAAGDLGVTGLSDIGSILLVAARDQSVAHAPLAIFVVVAVVLLLCMVRT